MMGTMPTQGDGKDPQPHELALLVGGRRLGPFRRYFAFPEGGGYGKIDCKARGRARTNSIGKKGVKCYKDWNG